MDCSTLTDRARHLQIQWRTNLQFVWLEYNPPWYSQSISRPVSCLRLPVAPGTTQVTSVLRDWETEGITMTSSIWIYLTISASSHRRRKCYTLQTVVFLTLNSLDTFQCSAKCPGALTVQDHFIFCEQTKPSQCQSTEYWVVARQDIAITKMIRLIDHYHYNGRFLYFTTSPSPPPPSSPFLHVLDVVVAVVVVTGAWYALKPLTHTPSIHPLYAKHTELTSLRATIGTETPSQDSTLNKIFCFSRNIFWFFRETGKRAERCMEVSDLCQDQW